MNVVGSTPNGAWAWVPWGVALLFLLWQVSFQFVYGFLADPIQKDFGLTAFEAASLVSVFLLTYGLMQVPAGLLLDRWGVRWTLPLAAIGAALSVAAFGEASGFAGLAAARVGAGAFMAFAFPAIGKIARRQLPAGRFVLAMAVADMAFGVGAVIMAGVTGVGDASAWRGLVGAQAAIGLALAAILAVALRPLSEGRDEALESEPVVSSLGTSLRESAVIRGALLYAWGAGLTFGFGFVAATTRNSLPMRSESMSPVSRAQSGRKVMTTPLRVVRPT